MDLAALRTTAAALLTPGKGLLAADESTPTIQKRFDSIGVPNTEENRRDYRELLFRTGDAMKFISGVILFRETLYQDAADGTPMVELIKRAGALPGIKVDEGAKPMVGFPGETITEGLDGLAEQLARDYQRGARFAKWRASLFIGDGRPTWGSIKANAHALARYAAICQSENILPIVEPEVLMDGDHDIDAAEAATRWTLRTVFEELAEQRVELEGMILKSSMVVPGSDSPHQVSDAEVAERSIATYKATVPAAAPGIVFLSGGQSDEAATAHLNCMCRSGPLPWKLTFSFSRALQHMPLTIWAGKAVNGPAAERAFAHRAHMNSLASLGQWQGALEKAA